MLNEKATDSCGTENVLGVCLCTYYHMCIYKTNPSKFNFNKTHGYMRLCLIMSPDLGGIDVGMAVTQHLLYTGFGAAADFEKMVLFWLKRTGPVFLCPRLFLLWHA